MSKVRYIKSRDDLSRYFGSLKKKDSELSYTSEEDDSFDSTDKIYNQGKFNEVEKTSKVSKKSLRYILQDNSKSLFKWLGLLLLAALITFLFNFYVSYIGDNINNNKSDIKELNTELVKTNRDLLISKINHDQLLKDFQMLENKYKNIDGSIQDYNLLKLEIQKDLELINFKIDNINK